MKFAITGKGGAGKSTLAAMMCHLAHAGGHDVLAVDADPDANLAFSLGIPAEVRETIIPVACRTGLIEERTGAKLKKFGQIFRLNPEVGDVAEKLGYDHKGINLVVLGAVQSGGSGCACPENVFLKHLPPATMPRRNDFVIVDIEAGTEHLGRGTPTGLDALIVVVVLTLQRVQTANTTVRPARL
ncbi:MAG: AAA family ATPase, partial [FCB group bacterium]|nr:AAA family ATPase [FCB group bacterium]